MTILPVLPRLMASLFLLPAVLALSSGVAQANMLGGGAISNFTDECEGWPIGGTAGFRATYRPSELHDGPPSNLVVILSHGVMAISLWGDMQPAAGFRGGAIRHFLADFFWQGAPPNRPNIRVVTRQITRLIDPAGPTAIENAQELVLRLRVQNFDNIPGCAATVAASLTRYE